MLAIHISREVLKYAQLVNFKGMPFIESLGKVSIKDDLQITDATNSEIIRNLAEQIALIRNSAEFPDNSTHVIIDSDWFPLLVHKVDKALSAGDTEKYLGWRFSEMLENAMSQYRLVHQALNTNSEVAQTYLSIAIPQSFDSWIEKVFLPAELQIKNVITDIQAVGDLLAEIHYLDPEGGIQVVLDNRDKTINCVIFKDHEYLSHFSAALNWDYKLTLDYVRGDRDLVNGVRVAIERALKGKQDPDNVLTNLYYFTSTGDRSMLNHLTQYENSCKPLNLIDRFNFREPDFENIDEYAVVLGALSTEIRNGFSED
ncbi:MAG: hypothetical protein K9N35_09590 [Candidatus Marinimicrobia bacterium]|nr:hypothetical protein [Candidatus Neomarinimicrobiota bacterium]